MREYPQATEVQGWLTEIKASAEETPFFSVYAANVPSVAVLRQAHQTYLLYNKDYLLNLPHPLVAKAILAHAIGQIADGNELVPAPLHPFYFNDFPAKERARIEAEYLLAEEFVGFIMYLEGAPLELLDQLPSILPTSVPFLPEERIAALKKGARRAEGLLLLAPSAAYQDNGQGNSVPGMPEFPFPPPAPSCQLDISAYFTDKAKLGPLADHLNQAFQGTGYYERKYYYVPGGFAMATRMEQFNADGSCKGEPGRWSTKPVREESFEWLAYLKALFSAEPGYFRVFVFVVSDQPWVVDRTRTITSKEAGSWLHGGTHLLPDAIRQQPIRMDHRVSVLIYEYEVSEATHKSSFSKPSRLGPQDHMEKSRLLDHLRRR